MRQAEKEKKKLPIAFEYPSPYTGCEVPEGILGKQGGDASEATIYSKARSSSFVSLSLYCCPCPHPYS
jgi:hypothetical protein